MRIQEVCRELDLTKKAVEYYIAQGLIAPHASPNGYRDFKLADIERLRRIAVLRRLGLGLADIREALTPSVQEPLKRILMRRRWNHDREQTRLALLQKLQEDQDWTAAERALAALDRQLTLEEKLLDAFPGDFGQYVAAHFASFLPASLDTPEQEADFATILQVIDECPASSLPKAQLTDSGWTREAWQQLSADMQAAAADPERFLQQHAAQIEAYRAYKQSPAYTESPAADQARYWSEWVNSSAYRERLLPALRRLSPAYRQYVEQLAQAVPVITKWQQP